MTPELAKALAVSSIEELNCETYDASEWALRSWMKRVCKNPRLQRVVCRGTMFAHRVREHLRDNEFPATDAQKFTFVRTPDDEEM